MRNFFLLSVLVFCIGLLVAFRVGNTSNQNLQLREFGPIELEITIDKSPKFNGQYQIIESENLKVFTGIYPRFAIGDILEITGEANSEGLVFRPEIKKTGRKDSALASLADLRLELSRRIDKLLPLREATLVKGMVLGVDEIDRDFREQLIDTGTIHAVVVSGQNLSIVAGFFMVFVKHLGRRLAVFFSVLAVVFYAVLTGFELPVVRATIMVILGSAAVYLGRERLVIWNLLLSALIIVLIWPEAIFDISYQLTFAATFGIMTFGQKISKIFDSRQSIIKLFASNAAVATSAYLFTAPIVFWHFERLSLIAPIVNILVAEAIMPIMVLGFAVLIVSMFLIQPAQILAYLVYVPAFYFVKVVEIFS